MSKLVYVPAKKHGHCRQTNRTLTWRSWRGMRGRCLNKNASDYPRYGGRGVKICDRWGEFENFLEDMGERPEGMTLDRIDSNGNYEPSNCRWATAQQQQENLLKNHNLTYKGVTKPMRTWAKELGLTRSMIKWRLYKLGWGIEDTFEVPSRRNKNV